jgi:predicted Fe-Mo cluster-binding NifX family protein
MEHRMRIAVATNDGISLSEHFGRSAGFIVFEVDDAKIASRETRTNNHTPHAQGLCQGGQHSHQQGHTHNHAGIVGLLQDCQVVLCGGMGMGAAQALKQMGIQPVVCPSRCSAEEALTMYLNGNVTATSAGFCQH